MARQQPYKGSSFYVGWMRGTPAYDIVKAFIVDHVHLTAHQDVMLSML